VRSPAARRWIREGPQRLRLSFLPLQPEPWMVKCSLSLLLALGLLVGCQSSNQLVSTLPPPTFDGPRVAPRPAVPMPQLPPPEPVVSVARATQPGVPAGWIPTAKPRRWQYIVIHHSATATGGAAAFDRMHRDKGWDELGYHFVIGNGTDTRDGQIEVGSRWPKQKYGAHCKTPDNRYNDYGIGICLVGNFDSARPTPAQLQSLAKLTSYLMKTYNIPASRVIGHGDAKPTECPGRNLSVAAVRRMATQMIAQADKRREPELAAASTD